MVFTELVRGRGEGIEIMKEAARIAGMNPELGKFVDALKRFRPQ